MFAAIQRRRSWGAQAVSFAVHCVALYLLLRSPLPNFVTPSSVQFGHGGSSMELTYLQAPGAGISSSTTAPIEKKNLTFAKHARPERTKPKPAPAAVQAATAPVAQAARAGMRYGSVLNGPLTGHDVKPALPMAWEDPVVHRSELPAGVEGSVIVEITIDAQGVVVATKVLQSLAPAIDEKVVTAVRRWRFRPATLDGVAIASQQDVYYHFPS